MKIIKTKKTEKDRELEQILREYPRKIDLETVAETLLNLEEKIFYLVILRNKSITIIRN